MSKLYMRFKDLIDLYCISSLNKYKISTIDDLNFDAKKLYQSKWNKMPKIETELLSYSIDYNSKYYP